MEHVGSSQNKTLQEDGNLQAGNGLQAPAEVGLFRALKAKAEGGLQQRGTVRGAGPMGLLLAYAQACHPGSFAPR